MEKTMSLKFNVPILKIDKLSASFDKPTEKNDNIKLFNGIYEGLGPVSIVVLYNIERQIEAFYKISNQINIFSNLNSFYLAKLFGIIVEKEKFCLIFERLSSSLATRLEKKTINDKEKFTSLIDIMELLLSLHENKLSIYDLRPSNVFYSEQTGDVRLLYPLENVHLFRDEIEEEEEIIEKMLNPDDILLRFTPPELLLEAPAYFSGNDIWMLGCLLVEIFSKYKVWDGYTENEIIKQLKNLTSPKVPNDIPQSLWGMICECLNPFHKARIDIKDTLVKFYYLCNKLGLSDLTSRISNFNQMTGMLPQGGNISVSSQNLTVVDDPYSIRKCQIHPKNMIDLFCVQCNDLICTKCQFGSHKEHNEDNVIVDIENYLQQAAAQFEVFKEKFKKFIEISSSNFPIDETIFEYINKQINVIDVLYDDHKNYITTQFDLFHKKIEALKELEVSNLNKFRDFFKGKFTDLENKIGELVEEKGDVEEFLNVREKEIADFVNQDCFTKETIVRRIQSDMMNLKSKKQIIMSLFKEYQKNIGDSDKIKRYFQRSIINLKENKAYDLLKVLDKLHVQLESKYKAIDLQDYMNTIIVELDEFALINSRNNAPKNVKEIFIACFKSKKVLSYNIINNQLNVIEASFKDLSINMFLNFSRSINVNGILYVNGGWDDSKKTALKHHLSFDSSTWKVTEEAEMLYGHSAHSLIYVPPNYIFVVSGSGIGKCEKFDVNLKTWEEIPEINYHRQNTSLFYHNEQYLYAFGGLCWDDSLNDFVFVETVERLDIGFGCNDDSYKWEIVPTLKSKDNVIISKSVMTVVPISSNKLLLVGGMFKDQTYSDDIILFDFEKLEFSFLEDLKLEKKTCFPNKYFLFFGDYAYQFDNEGDIHEFSVKDLSFKIVNHHKPIAI